MNKRYRIALTREFRKRMSTFAVFCDYSTSHIPPGSLALHARVADSLDFFVVLLISEKDDKFTIEILWTRERAFPAFVFPSSPYDGLDAETICFRITEFESDFRHREFWRISLNLTPQERKVGMTVDDVGEEAIDAAVCEKISEAMSIFVEKGIPYLTSVALHFGVNWQPDVLPTEL